MKFRHFLIALITAMLACLASALAQSPTPVPSPNQTTGDVILNLFNLVKNWGSLGLYAGIAAALKLIVDATKTFGLFDKIPAQFQAIFVLLVGFLTVGLTTLASGGTFLTAVTAAVGSSAGAMLLHELWQDLTDWLGKKSSAVVTNAAPPSPPPPAAKS